MNDKEFLQEIKKYIEDTEERIEDEWGIGNKIKDLIKANDMPLIYEEVLMRLDKQ